jgi:hypothetical protein
MIPIEVINRGTLSQIISVKVQKPDGACVTSIYYLNGSSAITVALDGVNSVFIRVVKDVVNESNR